MVGKRDYVDGMVAHVCFESVQNIVAHYHIVLDRELLVLLGYKVFERFHLHFFPGFAHSYTDVNTVKICIEGV